VIKPFSVGLLVVVALVVVAGGASPATPHHASAMTTAKKALLTLSDMPEGWTSITVPFSNPPTPGAAQLAHCIGVPVSVITSDPPSVSSPNFTSQNGGDTVFDQISIFPSAKTARADFDVDASPKAPKCLTENLNGPTKGAADAAAGSKVGSALVSRTPASDYGPHTTNVTIFVPETSNEATSNLEITDVTFAKGDEVQDITLTSVGAPFPVSLARHLTTVADARL